MDDKDFDAAEAESTQAVEYFFKMLNEMGQENGSHYCSHFVMCFMTLLTMNLVLRTLQASPSDDMTPDEQLKFSTANYKNLKQQLQNAIGIGFREGMESFSGQRLDYLCTIEAVPEPTNKLPC